MKKILFALLVLLIIPGVMAVSVSVNKPRYSTNEAVSVSVSQCGGVSLLNLNNAQGQLVFVDQGVGNWETNYHTSSDSSIGNYNVLVSCGVDEVQVSFCVGDATQCPTTGASSASSDSSGGGSGGRGSGILPGAGKGTVDCSGQKCTMTWSKIFAKEQATFVTKNIEMTRLLFTAKQELSGSPQLAVQQLPAFVASVPSFPHTIYQRFEIIPKQIVAETILQSTIEFRVQKSWVSQQKLGKNQVSLFRLVSNRWDDLQAKFLKEDVTYYYYSASTPGFSYFLIGSSGGAVAAPAVSLPVRPVTPTPAVRPAQPAPVARPSAAPSYRPVPSAPAAPVLEEEPSMEEKAGIPLVVWIAVGVVVIIGGVVLFFVLRKRQ